LDENVAVSLSLDSVLKPAELEAMTRAIPLLGVPGVFAWTANADTCDEKEKRIEAVAPVLAAVIV
jgi:hypothetical protein